MQLVELVNLVTFLFGFFLTERLEIGELLCASKSLIKNHISRIK